MVLELVDEARMPETVEGLFYVKEDSCNVLFAIEGPGNLFYDALHLMDCAVTTPEPVLVAA